MNIDIIDKVFKKIVMQNSLCNVNSIPHSDAFINEVMSLYGISKIEVEIIISILKESHKILLMEIAKEDNRKKLDKVIGYVDADLLTIQKLKSVFNKALEEQYDYEYRAKKSAGQIIRELIPRLMYINHTPVGKLLNKAIMLEEFERLVEKDYREFTEEWKDENLKIQISINEITLKKLSEKKNATPVSEEATETHEVSIKSKRAVDSPMMHEFINQSGHETVSKMLQIYGVDFFCRVNMRKYNFGIIMQALDSGCITRRQDLLIIKDMLKKIKTNMDMDIDTELEKYYEEIMALDRKVSRNISFLKK